MMPADRSLSCRYAHVIGVVRGFALLAIISLAGTWCLKAQDATRTFSVLGYGNSFFDGIRFEVEIDGELLEQELEFSPDQKSLPYRIGEETRELVFYRETENALGALRRTNLARVRIPSDWVQGTLVFLESDAVDRPSAYEILLLPEDDKSWGAGYFQFLNLSGAELQLSLGPRSLVLDSGLSETLRFPAEAGPPMQMNLMVRWDGRRRVVYATEVLPDERYGKLLVIKPPLDPDSLRVRVAVIW